MLGEVLGMSRVLVDVLPSKLVDYALCQLLDELPDELNARIEREGRRHYGLYDSSMDHYEWDRLSVDKETHVFDVASPLEHPFPALFEVAPDEGRRLVRVICNHAATAWRQLCARRAGSRRGETESSAPIPIELRFPWGTQTFWGDLQAYTWSRGIWGPHVAQSGLMALEAWAFAELDKGRDFDSVIQQVVEGHESVSVLGVAVAMLLRHRRATLAGVALIGSSRLWAWDIQRMMQDGPMNSNTIAFVRAVGSAGHKAVLASNALEFRRYSLRDLAPLFIFTETTAEASRRAIAAFSDAPPIDTTGQLNDPEALSEAKRTATIWSKVADPETYRQFATTDGTMVQIQHVSPHAQDSDVVATAAEGRPSTVRSGSFSGPVTASRKTGSPNVCLWKGPSRMRGQSIRPSYSRSRATLA